MAVSAGQYNPEAKRWNDRHVVLPMNVENAIDRSCDDWGSFKESNHFKQTVTNDQKGIAEIFWIHSKEIILREFIIHRIYQRQEKLMKTVSN